MDLDCSAWRRRLGGGVGRVWASRKLSIAYRLTHPKNLQQVREVVLPLATPSRSLSFLSSLSFIESPNLYPQTKQEPEFETTPFIEHSSSSHLSNNIPNGKHYPGIPITAASSFFI